MNNVLVKYSNNTTYSQNVISEEVAKKYAEAVVSVFKHDGKLDTIESITMTNQDAYMKILYQKEQNNA